MGLGVGWKLTGNGHNGSFWSDGNILKLVVIVAQFQNYYIVYGKLVDLMVCKVYLNKAVLKKGAMNGTT